MFRVTREIKFCFGHRLMNYNGKCRNLHGHNGRVFLTVASNRLDRLGMAMDFATIKKTLAHWINEHFDHKSILHCDDPLLHRLQSMGEPVFALEDHPTTENLAKKIFLMARELGIPVVEATLWENDSSCATYSETHSETFTDVEPGLPLEPLAGHCVRQPATLAIPSASQDGPFFVTREFRFCFGHRLQHYPGKCRQIHGHNGRLFVTVSAEDLDDMGMAADFGDVKRGVDRWINSDWDHSMILRHDDPLIPVLEEFNCAVIPLNENPTTENLAKAVFTRSTGEGLAVTSVQLWETDLCGASFAPAHAWAQSRG